MIFALVAILLVLIEAYLESRYGDNNHGLSLIVSILIFTAFNLGFGFSWINYGYYLIARTWFDLIFNYFRGNKWYYLGNISKTDKFYSMISRKSLLWLRIIFTLWVSLMLIIL